MKCDILRIRIGLPQLLAQRESSYIDTRIAASTYLQLSFQLESNTFIIKICITDKKYIYLSF